MLKCPDVEEPDKRRRAVAKYTVSLLQAVKERVPTPAHFATLICQNNGYIFTGYDKVQSADANPIRWFNLSTFVGTVEYTDDGSVIVEDAPGQSILGSSMRSMDPRLR